jgi:phytanoyl-CoA hydroxylase
MKIDNINKLKENFNSDGYVALYLFFDDNKIQEIKNELDRYIAEIAPTLPTHHIFYEDKSDKSTIKNLQQMFTYDNYFKNLIEESSIQEVASSVLGETAVPKNLQYFNKPAGVGKPTPPHQDGYYFMLKKDNAVTCWLALEKVDEENGCIHYVKGSHLHEEYRPHGKSEILGFSQGVTDFGNENDKLNTVSFPGEAGTFLMHNTKTIHWAEGNKSKTRTRKALGFIYYGESAEEDKEAHDAYQEKLRKELEEKNLI